MVTLPSEAATNYKLVYNLVKTGMNCARINCAHDSAIEWMAMVKHVRTASNKLGRNCKIAMDLGGPKIRTGQLLHGPKVLKYRPQKDSRGYIVAPLDIWMGPMPHPTLNVLHLPIPIEHLARFEEGDTLYCRDAREKKRRINIIKKYEEGCLAQCEKTTYLESGIPLFTTKDLNSSPIVVGSLPPTDQPIILHKGDTLRLLKTPVHGQPHQRDAKGKIVAPAYISCTSPAIFDSVKAGEIILFDDGKIKGEIKTVLPDELVITIARTPENGGKLRADKGINFPTSDLRLSGLTEKDREDLAFVIQYADVVNMSFVNSPEDVRELYDTLDELDAPADLGIILKIETQRAFNNLTDILLEGMRRSPIGVMIARGDLAIEVGWDNIARVQEEILSLCQAGHVTDIWATQVLENLAKRGIPSRAEITDAAMAQRADCVMLNKGPHILKAIQLLDIILRDLDPYQNKNAPMLPAMERANG
jgi:pyruvate kinase